MKTGAPQFHAWLDDFFAAYYLRRPVNATFVGIHQHDGLLPDFSEHSAGDTLAEMETLLPGSNVLIEPVRDHKFPGSTTELKGRS